MSPTLKQYVIALYESLKNEKEIDQKIFNFVKVLKKNNDLKLKNKIILEFEKYWKKEQGIIDVLIKKIKPLEEEQKNKLINWITTHDLQLINKKIKEVKIKEEIDKNLIGGMILKIGDSIIDGSIKKQLKILKEKLI
ncbi:ATP synthase F1 subunit delta [Candidatus Kuenenbacteria bacterium HGW-Kuenenbacteria-1]|uniref:ATP synthase F1 subunit delta n=1 Tax=Candidatus Kuenenbacteria bacterium HGW-Kuenenbacteria-1 TaxID=2013812 RepID=A0A2N1UNL1_9BACT|nr:MAG: ATP synthase F1 subunit delta [Candidatus Kuenenbacteria bacterium HGW-Kuenenbacteria-1]